MSPSDMVLKIENNTAGYNNLIRKADIQEYGIEFKLGKNVDVNKQISNIPSDPTNDIGDKGDFTPQSRDKPSSSTPPATTIPATTTPAPSGAGTTVQEFEDNKSALSFMERFIGVVTLTMQS